jgi:hypothetical protein
MVLLLAKDGHVCSLSFQFLLLGILELTVWLDIFRPTYAEIYNLNYCAFMNILVQALYNLSKGMK